MPTSVIYTLSLHDALPICARVVSVHRRGYGSALIAGIGAARGSDTGDKRSEEHTSELQSRVDIVCRLLLEKKKERTFFHARNNQSRGFCGTTPRRIPGRAG